MPRKFNPEVELEYGTGWYDGEVFHEAVMRESRDGKWVMLQTYLDTTSQLRQQVKRLQREVARLKEIQL